MALVTFLTEKLQGLKRLPTRLGNLRRLGGFFFPYMSAQFSKLIPSLFLGAGYAVMGMLEPWPMKCMFDYLFWNEPLPSFLPESFSQNPSFALHLLAGGIVLIALMRGIFYYYQQILTARAGQQIVTKVRQDLYAHIYTLSLSFHTQTKVADLLSHLIADMRALRQLLLFLPTVCTREALLMLGMTLVMSLVDWQLTFVACLILPFLWIYLRNCRLSLKKELKKQRNRETEMMKMATEMLGAIKIVQGFGQEKQELKKFTRESERSLKSGLNLSFSLAKLRRASDLGVGVIFALILLFSGKQVLQGTLTPGDLLVFVYYLRAFNKPLRKIAMFSEKFTKGILAGTRICNLMERTADLKDLPGAKKAPLFHGKIHFEKVCYGYQKDANVLNEINLTIEAKERVAIIGPFGSGKSTLVNLIPRFYDPTEGAVLIDGIDIRSFTLSSLRNQISIVFQEPLLFASSIAENIAYGVPGASLDAIKTVAKKVQLHEMIETLPDGYQTMIGQKGCLLSGGERQRLSIARAMMKNSPIVILDEPSSGVDAAAIYLIQEALEELFKDRTVILISHQKESICRMDRTVLLKNGKIIEDAASSVVSYPLADLEKVF